MSLGPRTGPTVPAPGAALGRQPGPSVCPSGRGGRERQLTAFPPEKSGRTRSLAGPAPRSPSSTSLTSVTGDLGEESLPHPAPPMAPRRLRRCAPWGSRGPPRGPAPTSPRRVRRKGGAGPPQSPGQPPLAAGHQRLRGRTPPEPPGPARLIRNQPFSRGSRGGPGALTPQDGQLRCGWSPERAVAPGTHLLRPGSPSGPWSSSAAQGHPRQPVCEAEMPEHGRGQAAQGRANSQQTCRGKDGGGHAGRWGRVRIAPRPPPGTHVQVRGPGSPPTWCGDTK